jgi:hypothetical protein
LAQLILLRVQLLVDRFQLLLQGFDPSPERRMRLEDLA